MADVTVPHVCPDSKRGMLPAMISEAAAKGNHHPVMTWLENGGDINAADMMGRTLVYLACFFNYPQHLQELLKRPDVHLDQWTIGSGVPIQRKGASPLYQACAQGHFECVEALLTSPSKCQIDLNQNSISALIITASNTNHWKIVELFLKAGYSLTKGLAYSILNLAVRSSERDMINYILKQDFTFEEQNFGHIVQDVFNRDLLDAATIDNLFKKLVSCNNDSAKKMLRLVLDKRDWKRLESLLHEMTGSASIDVTLCEAVLGYNAEEVERMLKEGEYEENVRNGALLVASIGGTTEVIADMLLDRKYNHSSGILADVLILASMYGRLELLPTLLKETTFTYKTLHRSMIVATHVASPLLGLAIKKAARAIIGLTVEKEDDDDEDDDDDDDEDDDEDYYYDEDDSDEDDDDDDNAEG